MTAVQSDSLDAVAGDRTFPRAAEHLLVGLSGSAASWAALDWAARRVELSGGVVHAANVQSDPWYAAWVSEAPLGNEALANVALHRSYVLLDEALAFAGDCGVELRAYCLRGGPVTALANLARRLQPDVIALGAAGSGSQAAPGRIARKVLRAADTPVVAVSAGRARLDTMPVAAWHHPSPRHSSLA